MKFDPSPFKVTRKKGTMVTALRNGKYVTRNASLFKRVNLRFSEREEEESDEDEDDSSTESNSNDQNDNRQPNNQNNTRRYPVRNRKHLN